MAPPGSNLGLGRDVPPATPSSWQHLPPVFAALGFASVAGVRGLAREPLLRRWWAYPIAAGVGWFAGSFTRGWQQWENAESVRLVALLNEKDRKIKAQPESGGRFQ